MSRKHIVLALTLISPFLTHIEVCAVTTATHHPFDFLATAERKSGPVFESTDDSLSIVFPVPYIQPGIANLSLSLSDYSYSYKAGNPAPALWFDTPYPADVSLEAYAAILWLDSPMSDRLGGRGTPVARIAGSVYIPKGASSVTTSSPTLNDFPLGNEPIINPYVSSTLTFSNTGYGSWAASGFGHGPDGPFLNSADYQASTASRIAGQLDIAWEWTPPEHIIVLTHGFQPGHTAIEGQSYLPEIDAAIRERLSDQISSGEVLLINPVWPEAFQPNKFGYETAIGNTEVAGARVAADLTKLFAAIPDDEEKPSLHFIGHSLGALVNAEAVEDLYKSGILVDQVTIIDSPRETGLLSSAPLSPGLSPIKRKAATAIAGFLFWQKMPKGSVGYVENFIADRNVIDIPPTIQPAFGQYISGTNPCDPTEIGVSCAGWEELNADHNTIHSQFYTGLVRDEERFLDWDTPALGTHPTLEWNPTNLRDALLDRLKSASDDIATQIIEDAIPVVDIPFIGTYPFPVANRSDIIDAWNIMEGRVFFSDNKARLISNSPSALRASLNVDNILAIEFDYQVNPTLGGVLELRIDDFLLWSSEGDSEGVAFVPLLEFTGEVSLTWTYSANTAGAEATFSSLKFLRLTLIPEPSALTIAITGFVAILARSRRNQSMPKYFQAT